jgi:hypothetical protein
MPDTTKTLTDLKTEAFGILVGLDPSQSPDVEDLATIGEYVDPLLAQLAADEIVYIDDSDAIPVEYFLPVARLLANVAGPRFGSPMNPQARQDDERALRKLTSGKPTFETMKVDYY